MPPTFYNLLSLLLRVDSVLGVRIDGVLSRRPLPPDTTEEHLSAPGSPVEPLANTQIRYASWAGTYCYGARTSGRLGRRGMRPSMSIR